VCAHQWIHTHFYLALEPAFGFLHEPSRSQTSQALVYDLQEPFRWLCDVTVIEAFESRALDLKDFYFMGDDYRYRVEIDAKRRFLELLKNRFNSGARYKGKEWKWNTIIQNKTHELAGFLLAKSESVDFLEPVPHLLSISSSKAIRREGIVLSKVSRS
jgi:CRISPR-associated protein Cas1